MNQETSHLSSRGELLEVVQKQGFYRKESWARKLLAEETKGLFQASHYPLGGRAMGLIWCITSSSFEIWIGPM